MDIKSLTPSLPDKHPLDTPTVKAALAPGDQAPHANTPLTPQTLKALQGMLQMLQLGKVFDVIVTRVEGSVVTLQVPGSPADAPVLQAELKSPPPIGTRLTLQLTEDNAKPELKVIATPNSPQDAVSRNLRLGLQQQRAMPPLLANLAMLAKSTGTVPADLPDEVIEAAQQLVQQLPHAVQLKAPRLLRQALQQTGPYLEASLARQPSTGPDKPTPVPTAEAARNTSGHGSAKTDTNAEVQARLEQVSQTLQQMVQAMRQQPVQDVRANLLRLAVMIRAAAEQQSLQKVLTTHSGSPAAGTNAQTARPASIPLPAALTTPQASPLPGAAAATSASNSVPGTMEQNTLSASQGQATLRSQIPQAQSPVQPSLAGILNRESALGELLGQVEGALARIQVQQLQTAATEQQHRPVWVMELPVRTEHGIDLFDLRIQRDTENHAEDDPKAPWTVSLAFDLEKLGAIRAQITLYGEDRVSTMFWAEQHETSTYFNQHLHKLEQRFKQVGLDVARVACRCGKPASPPPSREPRLVDEKV